MASAARGALVMIAGLGLLAFCVAVARKHAKGLNDPRLQQQARRAMGVIMIARLSFEAAVCDLTIPRTR